MVFFSGLDLSKGVKKKKKKTFHHIRNSGGESRYQKHNKTRMYHQGQDVAVRGAPYSEECSIFQVGSNRDSQVAGGDRSHLASMQKKQDSLKREGRRSLCMSFTAASHSSIHSEACFRFVVLQERNARTRPRFSLILNNVCLLYAFSGKVFKLSGAMGDLSETDAS